MMSKKIKIFFVIILFITVGKDIAKKDLTDNFAKIAIMEHGRIKPLDTFARNILKQISGTEGYERGTAVEWLLKVVFEPESTFDDRIFLITNLDVLNSIGISRVGKARNRYSYNQLYSGIEKLRMLAINASSRKRQFRDDIENRIMALYNKIYVYKQLTLGLSFLLIHDRSSASMNYPNLPFTVIPSGKGGGKWISPWDEYIKSSREIKNSEILTSLSEMYNAYHSGRAEVFNNAVGKFKRLIVNLNPNIDEKKLSYEVMYNKLDPFYKSKFFFGFSMIFLLLSFVYIRRVFYSLSFILLFFGFLLTLSGILLRMYIRARPPVTNLYETFVFTALITALLGIALELFKKRNLGILTGSLAGFIMLMIAGKYALDGDTMGMLVAVLDSNFWLAFHVITIILGYAGIVLSGVIGHVYTVLKVFKKKNKAILDDTFQAVYSVQAFGLVFTFLGTVLGGIWADQSWGDFGVGILRRTEHFSSYFGL
jgi:ABC-type transport system involved in cytochrome c biogenesis permease subunit